VMSRPSSPTVVVSADPPQEERNKAKAKTKTVLIDLFMACLLSGFLFRFPPKHYPAARGCVHVV